MALAKDIPSIQTYSCHEHFLGSENYRFDHDHHQKTVHDHTGDNSNKANSLVETKEYMFNANGDNDMYTFGHRNAGSSNNVLSFVQNESPPDQESYSRSSDHDHDRDQDVYSSLWDHNFSTGNSSVRLLDNFSSYQSASNNNTTRENQEIFGLFFDEAIDTNENLHVHVQQQVASSSSNKRQGDMGESNMQAIKKQCISGVNTKKPKPKTVTSKDPQSIAAKTRRERISERLKVLQELVPNGTKVDLVTMLEKAISYVKFLQLQVKVLATDDFWPVQGGKAPEISQVKEAIDAILSSQRDRN